MVKEWTLDIIIAIYQVLVVIVFGFMWRKRRDLVYWFLGLVIHTIGSILLIFQRTHFIIGYLAIIFNLLGVLVIIFSAIFEYNVICLKNTKEKIVQKRERNFLIILITTIFSLGILALILMGYYQLLNIVLSLEIVMCVITTIVTVLVLRIYLKQRTITRLFMYFVFFTSTLTILATVFGYSIAKITGINDNWAWTLSYVLNFIFITLILTTGLAAPIEKRITDSEDNLRTLSEHLEEKVNERTIQLEIANKELESFSYSVSHDLKSPIRSISGFTKAIYDDYSSSMDATGIDFLNRIINNCDKLSELIDDLLNLSRITRFELNLAEVNLSEITKNIANEFQQTYPESHAEFIIQEGVHARCDPILIELVLRNLINNALKFSQKSLNPTIEFASMKQDSKTIFYIKDTGVGFDMQYANKLFNVFQRLHSVSDYEGTGIGLATVSRIIIRHNGKIWAESEVNKGATFYFTLKDGI